MAVIKKREVWIGGARFPYVISCSAAGLFTIKLPVVLAEGMGVAEVNGKSLSEVEKEFSRLEKAWAVMKRSVVKVILWDVDINASIDEPVELRRSDTSFAHGTSLTIKAGVYEEIRQDGDKTSWQYKRVDDELPRGMRPENGWPSWGHMEKPYVNRMEWTAEREAFFNRLGRALEGVIIECARLLVPEQALAIADGKVKLALKNS